MFLICFFNSETVSKKKKIIIKLEVFFVYALVVTAAAEFPTMSRKGNLMIRRAKKLEKFGNA